MRWRWPSSGRRRRPTASLRSFGSSSSRGATRESSCTSVSGSASASRPRGAAGSGRRRQAHTRAVTAGTAPHEVALEAPEGGGGPPHPRRRRHPASHRVGRVHRHRDRVDADARLSDDAVFRVRDAAPREQDLGYADPLHQQPVHRRPGVLLRLPRRQRGAARALGRHRGRSRADRRAPPPSRRGRRHDPLVAGARARGVLGDRRPHHARARGRAVARLLRDRLRDGRSAVLCDALGGSAVPSREPAPPLDAAVALGARYADWAQAAARRRQGA